MRGKQAARAANRRAEAAQDRIEELRALLRTERADRKQETTALKEQVAAMQKSLVETAGKLAAEEITRLLGENDELRRQLSAQREALGLAAAERDYLLRSMCQYISMTEGLIPSSALSRVVTWATGERLYFSDSPDSLVGKLGVPHDGWVAKQLRGTRRWSVSHEEVETAPLHEAAENPEEFPVHKDYKPIWYERVRVPGPRAGNNGFNLQTKATLRRISVPLRDASDEEVG